MGAVIGIVLLILFIFAIVMYYIYFRCSSAHTPSDGQSLLGRIHVERSDQLQVFDKSSSDL